MCSICGMFGNHKDVTVLRHMNAVMSHRGPDADLAAVYSHPVRHSGDRVWGHQQEKREHISWKTSDLDGACLYGHRDHRRDRDLESHFYGRLSHRGI